VLITDHPLSLGKSLSCREREEKKEKASTLVYGEIEFDSFTASILDVRPPSKVLSARKVQYLNASNGSIRIRCILASSCLFSIEQLKHKWRRLSKPGGVFYDIGSGTGKPVFAACLVHDFDRATGIEILEGLHGASVELLDRWTSDDMQMQLPASKRTDSLEVSFLRQDFTTRDLSDATLLFANSTCFDDVLMAKLAAATDKCSKGTLAITFTRRIPSPAWAVLEHTSRIMSWGGATVYLQEKVL